MGLGGRIFSRVSFKFLADMLHSLKICLTWSILVTWLFSLVIIYAGKAKKCRKALWRYAVMQHDGAVYPSKPLQAPMPTPLVCSKLAYALVFARLGPCSFVLNTLSICFNNLHKALVTFGFLLQPLKKWFPLGFVV